MKIFFVEFCLLSQFPKPCGPEGSVSEPLGRHQTASLALPLPSVLCSPAGAADAVLGLSSPKDAYVVLTLACLA